MVFAGFLGGGATWHGGRCHRSLRGSAGAAPGGWDSELTLLVVFLGKVLHVFFGVRFFK